MELNKEWTPICKRCKRIMEYLCGDEKKFYHCPICDTRVYIVGNYKTDREHAEDLLTWWTFVDIL